MKKLIIQTGSIEEREFILSKLKDIPAPSSSAYSHTSDSIYIEGEIDEIFPALRSHAEFLKLFYSATYGLN